ncbi:MAG: FkbM family methyltransferase [Sedimenticola sp.]
MKENRYFPYISERDLAVDRQVRALLSRMPITLATRLYSIYALVHPHRSYVRYECGNEYTIAHLRDEVVYFPSPIPVMKLLHTSCHYKKWLGRKYSYPGFVEVEPNDVVVDCGAFVGGFSLSVIDIASHVYVFEPGRDNYRCLQRNLGRYKNASLERAGLYDKTGEFQFNISPNAVEHSLLAPDDNEINEVVTIKAYTLTDYLKGKGISHIDFCKVEAEGVEPEIIGGAGGVCVRKYAIDCSPERNGKSPVDEIVAKLFERGYEIRQRGFNLYARFKDECNQ